MEIVALNGRLAKHGVVLHLHNLCVVLLLHEHNALLLHLVCETGDLVICFLELKFVRTPLHQELVHFFLEDDLLVCAHVSELFHVFLQALHLKLVVLIDAAFLLQLALEGFDLPMQQANRLVIFVLVGVARQQSFTQLLDLLVISFTFELGLLEHHLGLVELQFKLSKATLRSKLSLLCDLFILNIYLVLKALN